MMAPILPRSWKEEFMLAAELKREEILRREKIARAEANERERTMETRLREKQREKETDAIAAAFLAPPERIVEFRAKLDAYDSSTIVALMDNGEALERVRERLGKMLKEAHTLPDGRRVFKTIDGKQVFDEHGEELPAAAVDPATIADKNPKWETFRDGKADLIALERDRRQLIDYQARLDRGREKIDRSDLSERDLVDLERDLQTSMPDAVRRKLMEQHPQHAPISNATTATASSLPALDSSELSDPRRNVAMPAPL